jgi:hypothetical protein
MELAEQVEECSIDKLGFGDDNWIDYGAMKNDKSSL